MVSAKIHYTCTDLHCVHYTCYAPAYTMSALLINAIKTVVEHLYLGQAMTIRISDGMYTISQVSILYPIAWCLRRVKKRHISVVIIFIMVSLSNTHC